MRLGAGRGARGVGRGGPVFAALPLTSAFCHFFRGCFSSARHIDYTPKSLEEYKQLQPKGGYYELGKLRPDLNSEELVEKVGSGGGPVMAR